MGYCLNAIFGDRERLQKAASATPPAVFVPLRADLGLIPLSEELYDAVTKGDTENYEKGAPCFTYLSRQVASWLQSLSTGATIAYAEAEYFGGSGGQCAVVWRNGTEVLPPIKAKDAINQALSMLGVQAAHGMDEFDTVGLGRHRMMEDWVKEGTVPPTRLRQDALGGMRSQRPEDFLKGGPR